MSSILLLMAKKEMGLQFMQFIPDIINDRKKRKLVESGANVA